jgi:hypothetical protein
MKRREEKVKTGNFNNQEGEGGIILPFTVQNLSPPPILLGR